MPRKIQKFVIAARVAAMIYSVSLLLLVPSLRGQDLKNSNFSRVGGSVTPTDPTSQNFSKALTTAIEVLKLSPEKAALKPPITLTGEVTFYFPPSQLLFIRDSTAGLYIYPSTWPNELKRGDRVTIRGKVSPSAFSAFVMAETIEITGKTSLEAGPFISVKEIAAGGRDSQWLQTEGIVQEQNSQGSQTRLVIARGVDRLPVLLVDPTFETNKNWVNAKVRMKGVAALNQDIGRPAGGLLLVQNKEDIEVVEEGLADPFQLPVRGSNSLSSDGRGEPVESQVHLVGQILISWPEESLFIMRDSEGIVQARTAKPHGLKYGQFASVVGFVRSAQSPKELFDVETRIIKENTLPASRPVLGATIGQDKESSGLVTVDATLIHTHTNPLHGGRTLILEDGGSVFFAQLSQGGAGGSTPKAGSRIRLTGALARFYGRDEGGAGPLALYLQSPRSITLLEAPPDLEAASMKAKALTSIGLALIFSMPALYLVHQLRGSRAQTAQKENERRAATVEKAELETVLLKTNERLRHLKEGQERLGRDLHDNVIQSIYAIGLNLENCGRFLDQPETANARLKAIRSDLNSLIRDVRGLIAGLENSELKPHEFRAALKSLTLTLGESHSSRMRLDVDQKAAERLNSAQAIQLLHVAREAMSNSIRHSNAAATTFCLESDGSGVRFIIQDDGTGFNPEKTSTYGLGLKNMAARAETIGGKFTIVSNQGHGTKIVLDIPVEKRTLSN